MPKYLFNAKRKRQIMKGSQYRREQNVKINNPDRNIAFYISIQSYVLFLKTNRSQAEQKREERQDYRSSRVNKMFIQDQGIV